MHKLTAVDSAARTATCSACGPGARIRVRSTRTLRDGTKRTVWRCTRNAASVRQNRRPGTHKHRRHLRASCDRCGFVPVVPQQLQGHHKDRNRRNNAPGNVETLCANCHVLVHVLERQIGGGAATTAAPPA